MIVWDYLHENLSKYRNSIWANDTRHLNYIDVLADAILIGKQLSSALPQKAKCAVLCKSGINTGLAILACFSANMVPVPMSWHYGEEHCRKIITLTEPDVLITDYDDVSTFDVPVFSLLIDITKWQPQMVQPDPVLNDVAAILCTSGTSGFPKGVMITEEGLLVNLKDIERYFHIQSGDTMLIARPLYHCAVLTGEFLTALTRGVNLRFYDDAYNPAAMMDLIQNQNITVMCGTPTLFFQLSQYVEKNPNNVPLRVIALSGECLSAATARQIRHVFPRTEIYHVYGLTEASPRVSYLPPTLFDQHPESVGMALSSLRLSIQFDEHTEMMLGVDGELLVKGPNVMKGYYRDDALTSKVLVDGWLHTGDRACVGDDGLLYIKGRKDDMIIKAGMNIYSKEIENALAASPLFVATMAMGISSGQTQGIALTVVLSELYKDATKREILKECARLLPMYQLPEQIHIVEALPRNASGKLVRHPQKKREATHE